METKWVNLVGGEKETCMQEMTIYEMCESHVMD